MDDILNDDVKEGRLFANKERTEFYEVKINHNAKHQFTRDKKGDEVEYKPVDVFILDSQDGKFSRTGQREVQLNTLFHFPVNEESLAYIGFAKIEEGKQAWQNGKVYISNLKHNAAVHMFQVEGYEVTVPIISIHQLQKLLYDAHEKKASQL